MNCYLVMTCRLPSFDPQWLEAHYAFLEALRREDRLELAGPFSDGSGGAYLFRARSLDEAQAIAETDPLFRHQCSNVHVHEWRAQ